MNGTKTAPGQLSQPGLVKLSQRSLIRMPLRVVVPAGDRLGEGPCWSPADDRLYWFDIKGRRLHWVDAAGIADEVALPFRASAAAARAGGGLLMATDAGLATFDPVARQAE